jgi:RNA polymerase sigma-70 factor, ECF subfamily
MDESGFREVYAACSDAVYSYARRRVDAGDADDLVADVFLVAWRRRDELPVEPLPWLLGVARRVLANDRRRERRAVRLYQRLATEPTTDSENVDPVDVDDAVLVALSGLGADDRDLLELMAWEGLSRAQLATVFDVSQGTIAVRIYRAKRRLAVAIDAYSQRPQRPLTGGAAIEETDHA